MFEHHREPVIPHHRFLRRVATSLVLSLLVLGGALGVGMLGYHYFGKLSWLDAFLNAAMILSGMGPVDEIRGTSAKIFAGCYALFSGVVFLSMAAILFAPLLHRLLHRFHRRGAMEADRPRPGADLR
ncbi:MAG: hypothetical protein L0271_25225 [Gemmatimonadetes bacterium]|nr:hypothetical protein [Gemmatimonadota bacterium]